MDARTRVTSEDHVECHCEGGAKRRRTGQRPPGAEAEAEAEAEAKAVAGSGQGEGVDAGDGGVAFRRCSNGPRGWWGPVKQGDVERFVGCMSRPAARIRLQDQITGRQTARVGPASAAMPAPSRTRLRHPLNHGTPNDQIAFSIPTFAFRPIPISPFGLVAADSRRLSLRNRSPFLQPSSLNISARYYVNITIYSICKPQGRTRQIFLPTAARGTCTRTEFIFIPPRLNYVKHFNDSGFFPVRTEEKTSRSRWKKNCRSFYARDRIWVFNESLSKLFIIFLEIHWLLTVICLFLASIKNKDVIINF